VSLSGHQTANPVTTEWLTPPYIISALGEFDLDPCAPVNRPWGTARVHYTIKDDGLSLPWFGRVWLNPPFGRVSARWIKKMADHNHGIALLAARTETKLFFDYVWGVANKVLFLEGRPHFYNARGERAVFNSGAPIVLIAYGRRDGWLLKKSGLKGFCAKVS